MENVRKYILSLIIDTNSLLDESSSLTDQDQGTCFASIQYYVLL
jgi:hypothetical protein